MTEPEGREVPLQGEARSSSSAKATLDVTLGWDRLSLTLAGIIREDNTERRQDEQQTSGSRRGCSSWSKAHRGEPVVTSVFRFRPRTGAGGGFEAVRRVRGLTRSWDRLDQH